jgi:acetyl esterase/lipase
MVHLGWLLAASLSAAAAAHSSALAALPLCAAACFCAIVAVKWHADSVSWKIKAINALANCIWPLSGLRRGRLDRAVFEALSLYTVTKRSPAPACDGSGVMRTDILVPRLSGVCDAGPVKIRLYQQKQQQQQQLMVYFHGGGFTVSHVDSADYDHLCAKFARRGYSVASVEYRLAPEHPFPAALIDAYDALLWCAGTRGHAPHASKSGGGGGGGSSSSSGIRIDGRRGIILAGDSAGGNLSAVLSQLLRDNKNPLLVSCSLPPHLQPKLAALLLIYPSVDRLNKYESDTGYERSWHLTPHTSHLTPHTSHLTPHTSHLTPHTSHLTPHTSHLTPHTSHLTQYPLQRFTMATSSRITSSAFSCKTTNPLVFQETRCPPPNDGCVAPHPVSRPFQFVSDTRVSPATAQDLSNLPPAVVMVCALDPLRDAGIAYAQRLQVRGVMGCMFSTEIWSLGCRLPRALGPLRIRPRLLHLASDAAGGAPGVRRVRAAAAAAARTMIRAV